MMSNTGVDDGTSAVEDSNGAQADLDCLAERQGDVVGRLGKDGARGRAARQELSVRKRGGHTEQQPANEREQKRDGQSA